jgi:Carbohydrate-selective porin, OprB family/S-layer homology domain
MLNFLKVSLGLGSAVFASLLIVSQAAIAAEVTETTTSNTLEQVAEVDNSIGQINSVSQLSDVKPSDWAYQAVKSLVERYGCISAYPDGTFKGQRTLTRYEFAAALDSCLSRVNELIAANGSGVSKDDVAALEKLSKDFGAELAILRKRVDKLEAKTTEIEKKQFSTTTKLAGEAIFAVTGTAGDKQKNSTVFQDRVRLNFKSSFTGEDSLNVRIGAGNTTALNIAPATSEGTQTFTGYSGNSASIDWIGYYTPVGKAQAYISPYNGIHSDYAATVAPYFDDYTGGSGALSNFASSSPIYTIGGGAGAGLNIPLSKGGIIPNSLTVGYLASQANSPAAGQGLFEGNSATLVQANFNFGEKLTAAATYVYGNHKNGGALFNYGGSGGVVGTNQANTLGASSTSNSYGLAAAYKVSDKISLNGFVSSTKVDDVVDKDVISYGVGIALPDFGKKGNVLGFFAGAEPYQKDTADFKTPYHIEGFYKYRVNDNVSITPGVIYLTNPGQSSTSDPALIGTIRTTFTF